MNDGMMEKLTARLEMNDDGCWVWGGATTHNGYGHMRRGDAHVRTHRLAWELVMGEIVEGMELDHLCSTRLCANPAHLEPVTRTENLRRTKDHLRQEYSVNPDVLELKQYLRMYVMVTEGYDPTEGEEEAWKEYVSPSRDHLKLTD